MLPPPSASRARSTVALVSGLAVAVFLGTLTASAAETTAAKSPLTISGDLRLRFEQDWDSQTAAGAARADRTRGRLRARANFAWKFDDAWTSGVRLRTGSTHSQQSPHLTFASNDDVRDDLEFVLDRYFVQYKQDEITAWAGRNSMPFWQQNEFFWDDDVTPTGFAGVHESTAGSGKLTSVLGAFALPDGGFGLNGSLIGGQVRYSAPAPGGSFTVAGGLHRFDGSAGADDLRNRNGERDYLIGIASAQWAGTAGGLPLTLGIDLFYNFENYDAADAAPLAPVNADETFGWVLSAQLGALKNPRDWQIGYYYAHIETFAVNASFAQDDWVRWGSATQTDGTDGAGHELRASYLVSKNLNLVARLFVVEAITSEQDGKRFRLDANWRF